MTVGDFNNDGLLDLVITGATDSGNVYVFQNLGHGVFTNMMLTHGLLGHF